MDYGVNRSDGETTTGSGRRDEDSKIIVEPYRGTRQFKLSMRCMELDGPITKPGVQPLNSMD
jgi:hypothetical protein